MQKSFTDQSNFAKQYTPRRALIVYVCLRCYSPGGYRRISGLLFHRNKIACGQKKNVLRVFCFSPNRIRNLRTDLPSYWLPMNRNNTVLYCVYLGHASGPPIWATRVTKLFASSSWWWFPIKWKKKLLKTFFFLKFRSVQFDYPDVSDSRTLPFPLSIIIRLPLKFVHWFAHDTFPISSWGAEDPPSWCMMYCTPESGRVVSLTDHYMWPRNHHTSRQQIHVSWLLRFWFS